MDRVDKLAVEEPKPHIVTSAEWNLLVDNRIKATLSAGYDVPECGSYIPPPKPSNESSNVPVVHSDKCSRSKSSGSLCTCGAGAKYGSGMTYVVVEKSEYDQQLEKKQNDRLDMEKKEKKDGESVNKPDNKNRRRSRILCDPVVDSNDEFKEWLARKDDDDEEEEKPSREKTGGGKKNVSFSGVDGGDDIEKLSNYYEMEIEPEPTCEKPYCPLFYQVIILVVLVLSLSLTVAFHTVYELTHQKRHGPPVNISVFHNSLNY